MGVVAVPQQSCGEGMDEETRTVLSKFHQWMEAFREREREITLWKRHRTNVAFWTETEWFYSDLCLFLVLLPAILVLSQGAKMVEHAKAIWIF